MSDIREVSYAVPDDGHGHLAEMRVDPIGLFQRVRDECGDIGRFRLADRDVVLVSRRGGQRAVLPGTGLDARPGRGVPVHDADLRQGRGLRRLARGAPADAEEPGAARRHDARPRRDHRGRDQPDGRRLGRRGRDRPARLVRRADHLHDVVVPDRQAVPRGARRLVRAALPRPRARHRRARVRRPVRRHRVASAPRRRPREAGRAGAGDHRQAQGPRHGAARGARPARRAHLDRHERRLHHRHLHLDDVRRPPHLVRHRRRGR